MGKEWLQRGRGKPASKKGRMEEKEELSTRCCMSAVFQLFDLHPLNQHNNSPSDFRSSHRGEVAAIASKGIEVPRNSLELGETGLDYSTAAPTAIKEEANLDFPVGIQIRTNLVLSPRVSTSGSGSKLSLNDFCCSDSPGTKTPTIVARLMGLDLFPECNSPSDSRHQIESHPRKIYLQKNGSFLHGRSCYDNIRSGSQSLPETPRISSTRRSDVDHHHRLSLQINKENVSVNEGMDRATTRRRRSFRPVQVQDENTSPGHSAKHFVEQVKDMAGRRFGRDITDTNVSTGHTRRDENLILLKRRLQNSESSSGFGGESVKKSCSPSPRYLDKLITISGPRSSRISPSSDNRQSESIINPLLPRKQSTTPFQEWQQQKGTKKTTSTGNCSSSGVKKLARRASPGNPIRNKKEETFVRSTARSHANLTRKKSKKDPSPGLTKLPPKQVSDAVSSERNRQCSRNPIRPYKPLSNGCATARHGGAPAEHGNYIQTTLERAGIVKYVSGLDIARWRARSGRINPWIFYYLEFFFHFGAGTDLSRRCNRKLIFELVDELLGEISRPLFNWVPRGSSLAPDDQFPLIEELCKKIDGFPALSSVGVDDIDSLIAKEMRKSVFDEELESIAFELEGGIMELLVTETAAMVVRRRGGGTDSG